MNSLVRLHLAFIIISSNFWGKKRLTILLSFRKGISHWLNQNKMDICLVVLCTDTKSLIVLCMKQSTPEIEAFKKEKIFICLSFICDRYSWHLSLSSGLLMISASSQHPSHPPPHSPHCTPVFSKHLSSFLPYTVCFIILTLAKPNLKIRKIWLGSNKKYLSFCVCVCLLSYHRTLSHALATKELHGF